MVAADRDELRAFPSIADSGLCEIPETTRRSVSPGEDLFHVTLENKNALCNDGTQAVIYVRAAHEGSVHADNRVV